MKSILSILVWTPPLAVPAIMLAICAIFGIDLDLVVCTFGEKAWRLGAIVDVVTLVAAMWEMARAVQIDRVGLASSIVGMIIPRVMLGIVLYAVPGLFCDLFVINLLIATIGAPGLAGLVRVSVAKRDISLAR